MWIMLMFRIASACATGHGWRSTSNRKAGAMLSAPDASHHARMLSRCTAEASDGCQRSSGIARAKNATCWPVPLAISSTLPRAGNTRRSTSRIGSRFRSVAAACSPPWGTGFGSKKVTSGRM